MDANRETTAAFTMKRMVQFAETDLAGVLHFANYCRYMEEAEHAFWRGAGFSVVTRVDGQEISWPRVAVSVEYAAPIRFEEEVELRLAVADLGRRSVSYEVEFVCRGRRAALGRMTAVCCKTAGETFEPVEIPAILRRPLELACGPGTNKQP